MTYHVQRAKIHYFHSIITLELYTMSPELIFGMAVFEG